MAKKARPATTKAKTKAKSTTPPRFEGLKLFFAGNAERYGDSVKDLKAWATEEGGAVQKKLTADTDLLVVLSRGATAAAIKQAEAFNKQGSAIASIAESDFHGRFLPSPDEVVELLRAGKTGRDKLAALLHRSKAARQPTLIDLDGADLRGLDLSELQLSVMSLDGADLREAKVYGVHAGALKNVRLEKAHGEYFQPDSLQDCNCKGAQLQHMGIYGYGQQKKIVGCDFTDANLDDAYLSYETIEKTTFKRAILANVDLANCTFIDVDFSGADLSNAKMSGSECQGKVSFVGTKLIGVKAIQMKFIAADLRKANFTGAQLNRTNFKDANIAGANFADAILFGAKFEGADTSKAKNFIAPPFTDVTPDTACRDLEQAAGKADKLTVEARVDLPEGKVFISATGSKAQVYLGGSYRVVGLTDEPITDGFRSTSLENALKRLGQMWGHGQLQFDTIKTSTQKSPLKGKALNELATAALAEIFAAAPPTAEELKSKKKKTRQAKDSVKEELLAELRGGRKGIQAFNKRGLSALVKAKLAGIQSENFSGAKLGALRVVAIGFTNCNFDKASLGKAQLRNCDLRKSSFRDANLSGCDLGRSDFSGCDLSGVNLTSAKLAGATLNRANFDNSDLTGADLTGASLLGAQLAGAKLTKTKWRQNTFDESTTFPPKFKIPENFEFVGQGSDPRLATDAVIEGVDDFDSFMARFASGVDGERLKKSLKMLKADRFELFSEVTDDAIVGVVKSQTDASLVYSCRLTSQGEFCCCTQNLNPCGGLRGALCKHLMVLIIGMTKDGGLAPQSAATWAHASSRRKPVLDKDAMSETLLRYKGAEAGEIDWRPTETVPEDYYAF